MQLFLTENLVGDSDVDGGTTILTSPVMTATSDSVLSYYRWYNNGQSPDDEFHVEVTSDGSQWVVIDSIVPPTIEAFGQWYLRSFRIANFVAPSSQFQVRFIASDIGTDQVVEAGVDSVRLDEVPCGIGDSFLRGDVNQDGTVNIGDPVSLLGGLFSGQVIPCDVAADMNDDDSLNVADAVYALSVLFGSNGDVIPPPTAACGTDPTPGLLSCLQLPSCP